MKYLPLVWSGMWRKRGRAILIVLQIAVAFALFGLLQGWRSGLDAAIDEIDADVFMVYRATGDAPLPLAHFGRLQSLDAVLNVQRQSFLGGTYQKPDQNMTAFATDVAGSARGGGGHLAPAMRELWMHGRRRCMVRMGCFVHRCPRHRAARTE